MDRQVAKTYTAAVRLSTTQLEAFYAGAVKDVQVIEANGRTLRFPLSALRPYVTREGIHGVFQINVSKANRLHSVRKVAAL